MTFNERVGIAALCLAASIPCGACASYQRTTLETTADFQIERQYTPSQAGMTAVAVRTGDRTELLLYVYRSEEVHERRLQQTRSLQHYSNWTPLREFMDSMLFFTAPISFPIAYSSDAGGVKRRTLSEILWFDIVAMAIPGMNSALTGGDGDYVENRPGPLLPTGEDRTFVRNRPLADVEVRVETQSGRRAEAATSLNGIATFVLQAADGTRLVAEAPQLQTRLEIKLETLLQ